MASTTQEIFVTGLRNAHALENQAVELLSRQVERIESYPLMADRLRRHIEESRIQAQRLEEILTAHGSSESWIKDTGLSIMGNIAALMHAPTQDEVLKNTFANFAFEHFEIAAYRGLLVMADACGDARAPGLLRQSLDEEIAMARWIDENLDTTVSTYIRLETAGEKAGV